MPCCSARPEAARPPPAPARRWWAVWRRLLLCWLLLPLGALAASSGEWQLEHTTDGLYLSARLPTEWSAHIDDVLQKGIPLYFYWQADIRRPRWYWRDKRLWTVRRSIRVALQPLTNRWRLSVSGPHDGDGGGGLALHQNTDTLEEALAVVARVYRWRLLGSEQLALEPDDRVVVSFGIDLGLLSRPLQLGIGEASDDALEQVQTLPIPPRQPEREP